MFATGIHARPERSLHPGKSRTRFSDQAPAGRRRALGSPGGRADGNDARNPYLLGVSLVLQRKYTPEAVSNLRRSDSTSPRAKLALGLGAGEHRIGSRCQEGIFLLPAIGRCARSREAQRMLSRLAAR